jgi:hypothetical protein
MLADEIASQPEGNVKLSKRQKLGGLILVGVAAVLADWAWPSGGDEHDYGLRPDTRSDDLAADLKLMWETEGGASTPKAIRAAERVFATVELAGLTRAEVIDRLGDPRTSSDSRYNFPFYPAGRRALVYRFDNGAWGCQYNVWFGWDGKVRRVQYLMIE